MNTFAAFRPANAGAMRRLGRRLPMSSESSAVLDRVDRWYTCFFLLLQDPWRLLWA